MKARKMAAKFPGRCVTCKNEVAVGDPIVWWGPGQGASHQVCQKAAPAVVKPAKPEAPAWWADMQCPDGCCGPGADFWPEMDDPENLAYWYDPIPPSRRAA